MIVAFSCINVYLQLPGLALAAVFWYIMCKGLREGSEVVTEMREMRG